VLGRGDGFDLNGRSFTMHGSGSSVRRLAVITGLLGLASCGGGGCSTPPQTQSLHTVLNMNMVQMMEHCRQMQVMDRARMTSDMEQMLQQCDAMLRAHGGGAAPGSEAP